MKQLTTNSLKATLFMFALLFVNSCSKTDGIGSVPAPPITISSFTASADSVRNGLNTTLKWSTTGQNITITQGNTVVLDNAPSSGTFSTKALTASTKFTITIVGTTIHQDISIFVWSPTMNLLGWDASRQQPAKWQMIASVSTLTSSINWVPGPIICNLDTYFPNNTRMTTIACGTAPPIGSTFIDGYQFSEDEKQINWGYPVNPPNTWIIKMLTETTLQLSQTKMALDGKEHTYLLTYQKVQ